tara:strand:+ start:6027 stop:6368 length:342 start_codon:yes stop_codon:yes gene_type:complete
MVKRVNKGPDGKYNVNGKKFDKLVGSRASVWHDNAYKTSGDLKKGDLLKNSQGRIVSRSKSLKMKKEKGSRFRKAGYTLAKKGKFGAVRFIRGKTVSATRGKTRRAKTARRSV